jgi:polyphosphate glucokinase
MSRKAGGYRYALSMAFKVLAIDIGGTNVKIRIESDPQKRAFPSGPELTPLQMLDGVKELAKDWSFDAVSIGLPAPIVKNLPARDPVNLGAGWKDFDYDNGFSKPVKLINDAAMQAVGSYDGGRMLFLGLGTGLGSCLIAQHVIIPTELAHMPYKRGGSFEDYVGKRALKKNGRKRWERNVHKVVEILADALLPDYVVIGGGNAANLKEIPANCKLGDNANAFLGGFRLWQLEWAKSVPVYDR